MSFAERLKVATKAPQQSTPKENTSVGIYGHTGVDWLRILVDTDGTIVARLKDPTGDILQINPDGSVNVRVTQGLELLAKESKQDIANTFLQTLVTNLGTTSFPSSGTVLERLSSLLTTINNIYSRINNGFYPMIVEAENTLTSVSTLGSILVLPWMPNSIVNKITVVQEIGDASSFMIELLRRNTNLGGERNVMFRHYATTSASFPRIDVLATFPYCNPDSLSELYMRITPNSGVSNNYWVNVSGQKAD